MSESDRIDFLLHIVQRECHHLLITDARLFAQPFDAARAQALADNVEDGEQTDAFVTRFGRLQDTLGDKLLPAYLRALSEPVGAAIDNLDRAERLGLLRSVDQWVSSRKLRNRMVHDYVQDPEVLASALNEAHTLVPLLTGLATALREDSLRRGLSKPQAGSEPS
jgi:hypothetical protein